MQPIDWDMILPDKDLAEMYRNNSLVEMEEKLGVSTKIISKKLKAIGVRVRIRGIRKQYDDWEKNSLFI